MNPEQEKNIIKNIQFASQHRIKRDGWLTKKRVLDTIQKRIELIGSSVKSLSFPMPITSFKTGSDNLGLIFDNFKKDSILDSELIEDDSNRVLKEHYIKISIPDLEKFQVYHTKITEIYEFIEQDGQKRFPKAYMSSVLAEKLYQSSMEKSNNNETIPSLSAADEKKLCILEKLKEEWDLIPDEAKISYRKHFQWTKECNISDYYEFEAILKNLQREGLIKSFRFVNPAM